MNDDLLLERVLDMEWRLFVRVKSERRAPCQSAPENFRTIRASLFETWTNDMLAAYLEDLERADSQGRNPLAEKYARMDKLIAPLSSNPLIQDIVGIETAWQRELRRRFPSLYERCCRSLAETGDGRNFAVYLASELETYGDRTLALYYENLLSALAAGHNLAIEALDSLVRKSGYRDAAHAEHVMARLAVPSA